MSFPFWLLVAGGLFICTALISSVVQRLPLTTAILYLAVGFGLGPAGLELFHLDPLEHSALLERISEIVIIISLFSAGLKLRTPLSERRWLLPVQLAFVSMTVTVGLVTAVGVVGLGLPLGVAVLLGAILAPTDPVLASDVQIEHPKDQDDLRFSLTGEAGLNDGTAFPFVMLGLGLLGLHEIGSFGWRWLMIDVLWAIAGGLGIGALFGTLTARVVLYLRREHREAVGRDDFLALGLIAVSYGSALLVQTYGFLAVFAAGLALRRIELQQSGEEPPHIVRQLAEAGEEEEIATHPETAPAYMAQAVLSFNEQLERSGEIGVIVLLGGLLASLTLTAAPLWFVLLLFLLIRPTAVLLVLLGSRTPLFQRFLMAWFGIRGIGSIYYLTYAIERGLSPAVAQQLTAFTLAVVLVSIVVHGISVTPLMRRYEMTMSRESQNRHFKK
jgi:NhaP-type Na+/H+ or K+/H+ antiporter